MGTEITATMASSMATRLAKGLGLRAQVLQASKPLAQAAASSSFRRTFASGTKGHTYEGVTVHEASNWHKILSQGFGGVMWFWIFYRFRHDYDTFLFGHAQHFEHELAHEKEGG